MFGPGVPNYMSEYCCRSNFLTKSKKVFGKFLGKYPGRNYQWGNPGTYTSFIRIKKKYALSHKNNRVLSYSAWRLGQGKV